MKKEEFTLLSFLIDLANLFYSGLVFMLTWNWIPSEIFNLQKITYAQGLSLFIFLVFFKGFKADNTDSNDKDGEKQLKSSIVTFVRLTLILILAFIVQAFI